jgi:hypothetical protein
MHIANGMLFRSTRCCSCCPLVSVIGFDWAGTLCHTSDIDTVTSSDVVLHTTACCRAFAIELSVSDDAIDMKVAVLQMSTKRMSN